MPVGRVLIRVEAGPHIGLGHLQRCLALAGALRTHGALVQFVHGGDARVAGRIAAEGWTDEPLGDVQPGDSGDVRATLDAAGRWQAQVLVVDSYAIDAAYLGALRRAGYFVAAIDDLAREPFPCQMVINSGAQAPAMRYQSSSGDTEFVLGPAHALLRPEFWIPVSRTVSEQVRRVLVTIGGADPRCLMPKFLQVLDRVNGAFEITAVIGPLFEQADEVRRAAAACRRRVQIAEGVPRLRDVMLEADVALTAAGQTLYELAATGTPAVAVVVAANQTESLQALARVGTVRAAGAVDETEWMSRLQEMVEQVIGDTAVRRDMSAAGLRTVDGQGARRVADLLMLRAFQRRREPQRVDG